MKKILTVSLFAMMAVTAANAEIASTNYVTDRTGDLAFTEGSSIEGAASLTAAANTLADKVDAMENGDLTIKEGAITSTQIATGAVGTDEIANGAVGTDDLAPDAVTNAKLADNAVQTENILNGTIVNEDLAADAVTNAKLADNAVQTENILNGTIVNDDLAEGVAVANIGYTPEDVTNKTQTVDEDSTATQYPSAAAVYSYGESIRTELSDGVADELASYAKTADVNIELLKKVDKTTYETQIGAVEMGTTATTLTGAIKEVKDNLGVLDVKIPALPAQTGMYSLVANDGVIAWEKVNPGN